MTKSIFAVLSQTVKELGATAVYRNTTTTADSITFELMTSFMKSNYNPNYLALYISPVDMPTFIDVDNDGDLDVLNH